MDELTQHVLVAGAGLAGLAAARELEARGMAVTVIDARDRVGGRVVTLREGFAGGQYAEGGADIIESGQTDVLALAKELRLPLVKILKGGFGFYTVNERGRGVIRQGSRRFAEMFAPFHGAQRDYDRLEGRWDGAVAAHFGRQSVAEYLVNVG